MDQLQLPLSFEDFIPENHMVRVVNIVVDRLGLKPLYDRTDISKTDAPQSPAYDFKYHDLFILPENPFFQADCKSAQGKYKLHVDCRREQTRFYNH